MFFFNIVLWVGILISFIDVIVRSYLSKESLLDLIWGSLVLVYVFNFCGIG